tara:strand:- start:381 stop:614 length:234 start_codon:yes stop_codon:yes gene_type:complete
MIQKLPHRQSDLSYIRASRYAGWMMNFPISRPVDMTFTEGHTRRHNGTAQSAFFCHLQPKATENKNLYNCKDDRTQS